MKTTYYNINVIFFSLILCSCVKRPIQSQQVCSPGYIWINYVGETNHIKRFTLIRTNEQDTAYRVSFREDYGGLYNDTLFFKIYCHNYIVDTTMFSQLKNYIKFHDTQKKEELDNIDENTAVKIIFVDSCDSIGYIVNGKDIGYFSNMIDSVKPDEELREYFEYYQRIQERNLE